MHQVSALCRSGVRQRVIRILRDENTDEDAARYIEETTIFLREHSLEPALTKNVVQVSVFCSARREGRRGRRPRVRFKTKACGSTAISRSCDAVSVAATMVLKT
jgi:hypothetical protein